MAAQIQEELSYYRKKKVDAMVKAEFDAKNGTSSQPKFMSLTNDSGRVIDVMVKPDGEPVVVEPKVQNTQQGMFTMSNPTNAVPLVDPSTGQQLQGYAAEANYGGAPAPMAGGGAFAGTNAPTPSPTPYPEGAKIRNKRDGMLYQVVNGVPQLIPGQ
jgi:hypothetical protein